MHIEQKIHHGKKEVSIESRSAVLTNRPTLTAHPFTKSNLITPQSQIITSRFVYSNWFSLHFYLNFVLISADTVF